MQIHSCLPFECIKYYKNSGLFTHSDPQSLRTSLDIQPSDIHQLCSTSSGHTDITLSHAHNFDRLGRACRDGRQQEGCATLLRHSLSVLLGGIRGKCIICTVLYWQFSDTCLHAWPPVEHNPFPLVACRYCVAIVTGGTSTFSSVPFFYLGSWSWAVSPKSVSEWATTLEVWWGVSFFTRMLLTENRPPGVVPAKARYMTKKDLVRISQYFQIPLRIPAVSICVQGKRGCVLVFQPDLLRIQFQ